MVTGYLLAAVCVILLLPYIARKAGIKKPCRRIRRMHVPLGAAAIAGSLLHLVMTFPVWKTRQVFVVITGIMTVLVMVVLLLLYIARRKIGEGWIAIHRMAAGILVCLFIAHAATYYVDFGSYKSEAASIRIEGRNAKGVKDGTYVGSYDIGYIYAKLEVTVQDQKMTKIRILAHHNERGKRAEKVIESIIKQQTTSVDAVSGATNSSHVIIKAVEEALKGK